MNTRGGRERTKREMGDNEKWFRIQREKGEIRINGEEERKDG